MRIALLLLAGLALSACGFHLRENVKLPAGMQRVHMVVSDSGDLQRKLTQALVASGIDVEDDSGPGIAELNVPTASFKTDSLSQGGYVRITEYAVRYHVKFFVNDANGQTLLPPQRIDMQREYSYDTSDASGNAAQVEQLKKSLNDDMVQAILFRLQAAGEHAQAVPAPAASAP
ncbi:MAG TPA: LPS assembly lipoprotein LptE [Rhodanobacter sp.]|nr:LPS assembly lipoprotein LptE [Rhodanobacter sp.]